MSLLILSCFCCIIIMYIFFLQIIKFHDYNVHASTNQPVWGLQWTSARVELLSPRAFFPEQQTLFFCSLVIIDFPKQQALSFWTLLILLFCYCTLCLSGCYCFALSLLYALPEQQALSFWFLFVLVAALLLIVVHFVVFFSFCFGLHCLVFVYFWVFCQPGGTRREIV